MMESEMTSAMSGCPFALLAAMVSDSGCEVSLGAYGAIGQFAREPRVFVEATDDHIVAATESSSISLRHRDGLRAIAFEMLSSDPQGWNCAVAICLPEADARMSARNCLTMLNHDPGAIFAAHRGRETYDIGLGTEFADIRVRSRSESLTAIEHRNTDRDLLADLMEDADCVWIFDTALGRIETRDRRRRHFIPQLLASGDGHSRTAPIPDGYAVLGYAFPPNPRHGEAEDALGWHLSFQNVLDRFGMPELVGLKRRVELAIDAGTTVPALNELLAHAGPPTRAEVDCIRVALRQRRWLGGGEQSQQWEEVFDRPLRKSRGSIVPTEMELA